MVHPIRGTGDRLELVVTNTHARIQTVTNQCLPTFQEAFQAQHKDPPIKPLAGKWSESSPPEVWSMDQQH